MIEVFNYIRLVFLVGGLNKVSDCLIGLIKRLIAEGGAGDSKYSVTA